jgi:hypothetical protein
MAIDEFNNLQKELESMKKRYAKIIREKEKSRKRQQDVHFTDKDKKILIESFVIGALIENVITKTISRLI